MKHINEAVIVAYGRAPVGKASRGSLAGETPVRFASEVLSGVLKRLQGLDPSLIDDIIVGCAVPEDVQGMNIARVISQRAGVPDCVPAQTVNRFCSSGLQSVAAAANAILAGQSHIIVAGGVESMSMLPMSVVDQSALDQWLLRNKPGIYTPMGMTAEYVADQYDVSRADMDAFSQKSHEKSALAQLSHSFDREIVPVSYMDREGAWQVLTQDEGVRADATLASLSELRPAFRESDGRVTAGNSSQMSDGAAFVVLMSEEKAKEMCIKPVARFVGYSVAGVDPSVMGIGPVAAIPKLMRLIGMEVSDFDVIELNEAFAAQALACIRQLGLDERKVNPRGGAIALGHPLGATGANLLCKALSYLEDTGGRYALVSMCVGGGMGAAGAFEMLL